MRECKHVFENPKPYGLSDTDQTLVRPQLPSGKAAAAHLTLKMSSSSPVYAWEGRTDIA